MTERKDIPVTNSQTVDGNSGDSKHSAVSFDTAEFMHFLDDTDWSDEQKAEYISLVWNIVCEFVALGFDVHPLQQAQENCGQHPKTSADKPLTGSSVVDSSHNNLIEEFVRRSDLETVSGGEGVSDG